MSYDKKLLVKSTSSIEKLSINLFLPGCDGDKCEIENTNYNNRASSQNIYQQHNKKSTSEIDSHQRVPPHYKAKKLGERLREMRQHLDLNFDSVVTSSSTTNYSRRQHNYNNTIIGKELITNDTDSSISSNSITNDLSITTPSTSTTEISNDPIGLTENPTLSISNSIDNSIDNSINSSINNSIDNSTDTSFSIQSPVETIFEKFYKTFRDDGIRQELKLLSRHHQEGVWVIPSCESLQVWFGVLVVKEGLYQDGVLHFTVYFKDDFPQSVPVIRFRSRVFHPQVEIRKGTFNLSGLRLTIDKSDQLSTSKQSPGRVYVWQLLKYLRDSFHHIDVTLATNKTAAILYQRENKEEFIKECRNCVHRSIDVFRTQETFGVSNLNTTENIINNPFKGSLVDDHFYKGFVQFLVANEDRNRNLGYNGTSLSSAFGWAKNQLGRVLNNLNTSYSLIDGDDVN